MSTKEEEARSALLGTSGDPERDDNVLPIYSATGPTTESPFDFPSDDPPPAFAPASSSSSPSTPHLQRLIAIPQTTSTSTSPFLNAYAQPLLQYGIPPSSFHSFLTTLSAFLAATVSDKAISHAADIGRSITTVPKRLSQHTLEHAKSVGTTIRNDAKSGNYVGAAMGVVSGAIMLPVGTAVRAAGAVISLPGASIKAVSQKPLTARERAASYVVAANRKWYGMRGLRASLMDTAELARAVGLEVRELLELTGAKEDGKRSAKVQIEALREYICELEIFSGGTLDLRAGSLWLVIERETPVVDRKGGGL